MNEYRRLNSLSELDQNIIISMESLPQNNNSPMREFFKNKTLFLTGGTGFLGKLIIEKLLR